MSPISKRSLDFEIRDTSSHELAHAIVAAHFRPTSFIWVEVFPVEAESDLHRRVMGTAAYAHPDDAEQRAAVGWAGHLAECRFREIDFVQAFDLGKTVLSLEQGVSDGDRKEIDLAAFDRRESTAKMAWEILDAHWKTITELTEKIVELYIAQGRARLTWTKETGWLSD